MSFIAWFYRQLKKLDQSLDEFYEQFDVVYNPSGTIEYIKRHKDDIPDEPEDDQDVLK